MPIILSAFFKKIRKKTIKLPKRQHRDTHLSLIVNTDRGMYKELQLWIT